MFHFEEKPEWNLEQLSNVMKVVPLDFAPPVVQNIHRLYRITGADVNCAKANHILDTIRFALRRLCLAMRRLIEHLF